jgi:hypothetical protein
LTSSEEFHSLKKTFSPCSSSHRFSRYICVDFPDPSNPSTAISRPGNPNSANVFIATIPFTLSAAERKTKSPGGNKKSERKTLSDGQIQANMSAGK